MLPIGIKRFRSRGFWQALLLVTVVSFFTHFHGYTKPSTLYWDEHFHVTSAQKYLHRVFFMELHPPLGKLLMALGEAILKPNLASDQFIGTTSGSNQDLPVGFSFAGYRLLPALMGWLTAPLFFLIFERITRDPISAALLSGLYVFDNALIVHSRAALLESPLLFFCALFLLVYLRLYQKAPSSAFNIWEGLLTGALFGCVMSVKVTGLILILLIPALLYRRRGRLGYLKFLGPFFLSATICWGAIWQIHFSLSERIIETLDYHGYYLSSQEYRQILKDNSNRSLVSFPVMIRDSLRFSNIHNRGVPKLNLCKPDESGSPAFFWPLGGRAINYIRQQVNQETYRYIYLQANPLVWWAGLAAVLTALALLVTSFFFPDTLVLKQKPQIIAFSVTYWAYLAIMMRIERVMYLYHYFVPLIFSFLLIALLLKEIEQLGNWQLTKGRKRAGLAVYLFAIFSCFIYFAPLTYYVPIDHSSFNKRAWLSIWNLKCADCPPANSIATALSCQANQVVP